MKNGTKAWIAIFAGALIGFALLRKHSGENLYSALDRKPVVINDGQKQAIIEAPAKANPDLALEQARKNYNIALLNGITKVPATNKGNKLLVTISPKPEAQWCKSGDFDLIKMLATNPKDRLITVSLEALDKNGTKRSRNFNLGELNGDRSATFEIPMTDGAYGLYLCSDQGRRYTCGQKKPVPTEIWSVTADKVKKLAVDKIFYFQLLYVKNGTLNIIPSDSWGKANLKELKSRLGGWMGDEVDALDKMDSLVSKLRPMPARLTQSKVEIPLPYNDLRCLGH